ncbi:MAG: hypothetical protein COB53_03995 [Elusimicrobia bacterium]|nr:MAG: hypothetical protein COB53_03995 [Elusimicrobiota bacterium]
MKKIIVTTTINAPTKAILKFDALEDWEMIVIGDKKTPADYKLKRGRYVGPEEQEAYDKPLSDAIGWNKMQRRNFGFLLAHEASADIVATIDDDNIPFEGWGPNLLLEEKPPVRLYKCGLPVFDPIGATEYKHLWHRGYPIQHLHKRTYDSYEENVALDDIDVQADFWNGDPDIDAFCRMEHRPECTFKDDIFPLASDKWSPFDSQNTFLKADTLKNYFMFPFIGRMDDIWGSYFFQAMGGRVAFNKASVYQDRNVHDFTKDMVDEFLGYQHNLKLVEALLKDPENIYDFLPKEAAASFDLYRKHF